MQAWILDQSPGAYRFGEIHDPAVGLYCLGQATAHLTLQAHAMGLWAHQFQGFAKDEVSDELGCPPHWRVIAGIAIGVRGDPAEVPERDRQREQRVRSRKDLAEIAYGDAWGDPWTVLSD